jgi:uncharacterized protein YecT (DUF1311 family)
MLHFNHLQKLTTTAVALNLLAASVPARAADYAPIDCSKASSPAERAICRSYPLGQAEARMATMFGVVTSLVAMGQRGDIGEAQRKWLKERNACGDDSACIARLPISHHRSVRGPRCDRVARSILNIARFDSRRRHRPSLYLHIDSVFVSDAAS